MTKDAWTCASKWPPPPPVEKGLLSCLPDSATAGRELAIVFFVVRFVGALDAPDFGPRFAAAFFGIALRDLSALAEVVAARFLDGLATALRLTAFFAGLFFRVANLLSPLGIQWYS